MKITINQKDLIKMAEFSQEVEKLAIKVINNPSDKNLVDYNDAVMRLYYLVCNYTGLNLTKSDNQQMASKLFLSKKEELINKGYWV